VTFLTDPFGNQSKFKVTENREIDTLGRKGGKIKELEGIKNVVY
jgi:hypothetical protein